MKFEGLRQAVCLSFVFVLCAVSAFAQTATGTLRGQVSDQLGGIVVGATVTAIDASGNERTATTNDDGSFTIGGLAPGVYTVRATGQGFATFEATDLDVVAGRSLPFDIQLGVSIEQESVTVSSEGPVSTEPTNNQDALVLRGGDLDALPDDPDDLEAALQALAGPSAGPNGGQIYIDGFTGGRLPPKESIREIRINQNPFSAEFDRLGFGRVEILTRPGTDRFRGQSFFNFGDESLNSRNPFVINRSAIETKRPSYQQRRYGGNVSGPIISKRASFFLDFERREVDDNAIINALVLDNSLLVTPFNQVVITPTRRTTFSPRFDYQINQNNTLVGRYSFSRRTNANEGINETSLPERAYDVRNTQHTFQLTETAVIGTVVNETRFQFTSDNRVEDSENTRPIVSVLDAFTAGSPSIGFGSRNPEKRFELQNFTSFTRGNHSVKAGGRFRRSSLLDFSPDNYAGTFTFSGIDQYREAVLGNALPRQFSINAGNPEASVTQNDLGLFVQDDWRVSPELTFSGGLRYETQSNINSNLNFAPRVAFAYAPARAGGGNNRTARTVFRGGIGVFYERFGDSLVLQSIRLNGENQQLYIVNPQTPGGVELLSGINFGADGTVTNVPSIERIRSVAGNAAATRRVIADDLSAPYTIQGGLSVEREIPFGITLTGLYNYTRTVHALRSRNINAPRLVTNADGTISAIRPDPTLGNVFQYESSGIFNQNQFQVFARSRFGRSITFTARYALNFAKGDTDSANTFPSDSYDLSNEYGRASNDIRHNFFLFSNFQVPFGFNISPFVIASSGRPFNITTGNDNNLDTQFLDRPTFDQLNTVLAARNLTGAFGINPESGTEIIPRNYGTGPKFFNVNLRIGRTFGFGGSREAAGQSAQGGGEGQGRQGGGRGGGGQGGGGFGGGRGGGGGGFGGNSDSRYNLNFSVQIQNLFNRANLSTPVGNLTSSRFGQSLTTVSGFGFGGGGGGGGGGGDINSGNRRIEAQIRFNF